MRFVAHDLGTFQVRSRSRDGHHIVDLIDCTCTCESFGFNGTCEHLRRALEQKTKLRSERRKREKITIPLLAV